MYILFSLFILKVIVKSHKLCTVEEKKSAVLPVDPAACV